MAVGKVKTKTMIHNHIQFMSDKYDKQLRDYGYDGPKDFMANVKWLLKLPHPDVPDALLDELIVLQDILYNDGLMIDHNGKLHDVSLT